MGRIAPKRKQDTPFSQRMESLWLILKQRFQQPRRLKISEIPAETTGLPTEKNRQKQRFKAIMLKAWHLPDAAHWMEPLPLFHRRWLSLIRILLILIFLCPSASDSNYLNDNNMLTSSTQEKTIPLQAKLLASGQPTAQDQWVRYQITSGQTLAQLFRDHNLPVSTVFAMSQVEGSDKPLSNLAAGQEVRIERDGNGVIIALSVTTRDNHEALFRRQPAGNYLRVR